MNEIINLYLERLIELSIYPFAPLEVNFIINFVWVVFRSIFKASADFRYRTLESDESEETNILPFIQLQLVFFLFSFLVVFMIVLSMEFWFTYFEVDTSHILWWLPSLIAICLAEFSGYISAFVKSDDGSKEAIDIDGFGETEAVEMIGLKEKRKTLGIYFILSFLGLAGYWGYMLFKHFL